MTRGDHFAFGPFRFDPQARRLTRDDQQIFLTSRQLDLLQLFVSKPGQILSRASLIAAAWPDVAATDNSLDQAMSSLRKTLGSSPATAFVETVPRRGYRFAAPVTRVAARESDEALDALLAPHRAWLDGRAAVESLERDQIVRARGVFEEVLAAVPDQPSAHIGLANACAMAFETTRSDAQPDRAALALALHHSREACRLDPGYGEAWATLGFVLARMGPDRFADALAASRRAVSLEPDNWRHRVRLSSIGWGEERLREARRTLALLPGCSLAHWLAASVHVARQAFDEAERELESAIAADHRAGGEGSRFTSVALHWLLGLLHLARGDEAGALIEFERELALESSGHLYARECCANTWYAIGAVHLSRQRFPDAGRAFQHALDRVSRHVMANSGLRLLPADARPPTPLAPISEDRAASFDQHVAAAIQLTHKGRHQDAATLLEQQLSGTPPGNAGWLIPIEPLLHVDRSLEVWSGVLATLRMRAA